MKQIPCGPASGNAPILYSTEQELQQKDRFSEGQELPSWHISALLFTQGPQMILPNTTCELTKLELCWIGHIEGQEGRQSHTEQDTQ